MRRTGERLDLDEAERGWLAAVCAGGRVPALTVESFAEWLADAGDGLGPAAVAARRKLVDAFCAAMAGRAEAGARADRVWAVTRHPGALAWLNGQGLQFDRVVAHLDACEPAPGDTVIGILPLALAARLQARGVQCLHLVLDAEGPDRGREMSPARMRACGARLERYQIERMPP